MQDNPLQQVAQREVAILRQGLQNLEQAFLQTYPGLHALDNEWFGRSWFSPHRYQYTMVRNHPQAVGPSFPGCPELSDSSHSGYSPSSVNLSVAFEGVRLMKPRRVGFLGFDGVMALDLVGPIDAFASALVEEYDGTARSGYEILIIGLAKKPFVSESGILFKPHTTLQKAPALDTLMIPGGPGLR